MLFQYLSGFGPIFYTTHTNEEPEKAYQEYDIFNKTQPIESDFDKVVKGLAKTEK